MELTFDDLGLDAGVWTSGQTRYSWELEDAYHGIEVSGESDATDGARQRLRFSLDGLRRDLTGVDDSEYTATMKVEAWRNGERVGRPAVLSLRWDGGANGYRVVALRH